VVWTVIEPDDGQPSATLPSLPSAHAAEDPATDPGAQGFGAAVFYVDYDSGFSILPPSGDYRSHSSSAQTYNMRFPF
jgi:hypothetical protein